MALMQGKLESIAERYDRSHEHGGFQALLGEAAWRTLPASIRTRFSRTLAPGASAAFVGSVASTKLTRFGWLWAQLARLIGSPLPLHALAQRPAAVLVTQADRDTTQIWTRIYHEPGRLPQVIRSMKRFAGPTGLEECVSGGIGMSLVVTVEHRAIVFRSQEYFWRCGRLRWRIPAALTPGKISVTHRQERAGEFSFTLQVDHPWFGETVRQIAFFRDLS